jgi:hypothetical protein
MLGQSNVRCIQHFLPADSASYFLAKFDLAPELPSADNLSLTKQSALSQLAPLNTKFFDAPVSRYFNVQEQPHIENSHTCSRHHASPLVGPRSTTFSACLPVFEGNALRRIVQLCSRALFAPLIV